MQCSKQLADEYAIPGFIWEHIESGFLQLLRIDEENGVWEFHIPSKVLTYADGSVLSYELAWYRPGTEEEGPPFELVADHSSVGPEDIGCAGAADLDGWLRDLRDADHY